MKQKNLIRKLSVIRFGKYITSDGMQMLFEGPETPTLTVQFTVVGAEDAIASKIQSKYF